MLMVHQLIGARVKTNKKRINELSVALSNVAEGSLLILHRDKAIRFLQYSNGTKKYLNKKNKDTIISLAKKLYYSSLQKELISQGEKLQQVLNIITDLQLAPTADAIYNSMPEEIKELISKDELDNNFANQWQSIKYSRMPVSEDLPFYTAKNEHVRSKSELIIANALKEHDIPYHYECPLDLKERTVHPDFTILNKRTREIYIWEHFGMLDDKEYSIKALNKLELYIVNNYIPNRNLIITYETSEAPLSTQTVANKIAEFLK